MRRTIKYLIDSNLINRDDIKEYNEILLFSLRDEGTINLILQLIDLGLDIFQVNENNENILFFIRDEILFRYYVYLGVDPHHTNCQQKNLAYYAYNAKMLTEYKINIYKNGKDVYKCNATYHVYKCFLKNGYSLSYIIYCLLEIGNINHPVPKKGNTILFYINDEIMIEILKMDHRENMIWADARK